MIRPLFVVVVLAVILTVQCIQPPPPPNVRPSKQAKPERIGIILHFNRRDDYKSGLDRQDEWNGMGPLRSSDSSYDNYQRSDGQDHQRAYDAASSRQEGWWWWTSE
ncbi:uncharacterized protein LOC125235148 [Leguminivora glycinivorella]|uniref:uncharacterized protein LOC125235148 n=1 Tax=Leguminivora glycinivorella TaxID=1035111 RepID=UPI00201080FF|nr:uncharacterized protein LOC125235148 [Leguminivora glycinivorella]